MQNKISERLRKVRSASRLTQEKVAQKIGIKQRTYASYEEGRSEPAVSILMALADLYGFSSLDELLGLIKDHRPEVLTKYGNLTPDKRKIVDFILNAK